MGRQDYSLSLEVSRTYGSLVGSLVYITRNHTVLLGGGAFEFKILFSNPSPSTDPLPLLGRCSGVQFSLTGLVIYDPARLLVECIARNAECRRRPSVKRTQEFTVSSKQPLKTHCSTDLHGHLAW